MRDVKEKWAATYREAVLEVHVPKKLALAAATRHAIAARLHDGRVIDEREYKLIYQALKSLQTLEGECQGWPIMPTDLGQEEMSPG